MKVSVLLFTILFCCFSSLLAQNVVALSFSILDSTDSPIEGALVTIENEHGTGFAFSTSDENGTASINISLHHLEANIRIKISSINFKSKIIPFEKSKVHYTVHLESADNVLSEVTVKGHNKPRIVSSGDTLSYRVNDFKSPADRTIADVIRKLPGIEVNANGMIYFRGRPISNFYIEGDDLLGQKYTLASENIRADIIDSIQVIDNNQPVRVLQGVEAGSNPAINLRLKNDAGLSWIKRIEAATGIPLSYNAVASAMAFKPDFKTLNLIKSNDAGSGFSTELTALAIANSEKWIETNVKQDFLSTGNFYYPRLDEKRWLFNKSTMISTNSITKGKNHSSFKLNASLLDESLTTGYSSVFSNYGISDTISYTESANEETKIKAAEMGLNYNANRQKIYLNENLNFHIRSSNIYSHLLSNTDAIQQSLQQPSLNISNSFSTIQLIRNRIISRFTSTFEFNRQPENLSIIPGVLPDAINDGTGYRNSIQNITYSSFSTTNAFGIKLFSGKIYHSYLAGLNFDRQSMASDLTGILNNDSTIRYDRFNGEMYFNRLKPFVYSDWNYANEKHDLSASVYLKTPIIYYDAKLKDQTTRKYIPTINPAIKYKMKIGRENNLIFEYGLNHFEGDVQDVYAPVVLRDYRTLISKNLPFYTRSDQSVSGRFNLQNSLKILFANVAVTYSRQKMNYVTSYIYSPESTILTAVPHDNIVSQTRLSTGLSKYLFSLKTNVELKASTSFARTTRLQDSSFFPVKNTNQNFEVILRKKIGSYFSASYKTSLQTNKAIIANGFHNDVKNASTLQHQLTLDLFPSSDLRINMAFQSKNNKIEQTVSSGFFMIDAGLVYSLKKQKMELSLKGSNLTGLKNYQEFYFNENSLFVTSFSLRPRTFMIGCSIDF